MRLYHGWTVVALSIVAYTLVLGTTINAFGLFVIPVSQELGLSRATMNTGLILLNIGNGVLAPFIGRLLDKYPAKPIMLIAACLLGAGFGVLGATQSIWLSALVLAVVIPFGVCGSAVITMNLLVARWFDVHRSRAMALSAVGMSLSGAIMPAITGLLIEHFGWRIALMVTGGTLTIFIAAVALIIRERPGPEDIEPGAEKSGPKQEVKGASRAPWRVAEILRATQFWTICLSVALSMGAVVSIALTLVPLAIDRGITMMQATSLLAVSSVMAVVANLLLSTFADRVDKFLLMAAIFLLLIPVNTLLIFADNYVWLFVSAASLGLSSGATFPLFQSILVDRFGIVSYGTVRGMSAPVTALVAAICMRLTGEIFDRTGSYTPIFLTLMGAALIAVALIASARRANPRAVAALVGEV